MSGNEILAAPTAEEAGESAEEVSPAHDVIGASVTGERQPLLRDMRSKGDDSALAFSVSAALLADERAGAGHDHRGVVGKCLKIEKHEVMRPTVGCNGKASKRLERRPGVAAQACNPACSQEVRRHEKNFENWLIFGHRRTDS